MQTLISSGGEKVIKTINQGDTLHTRENSIHIFKATMETTTIPKAGKIENDARAISIRRSIYLLPVDVLLRV